jgi:nicotinate-nucleotide pyrophosphorylase (carboxylating)
VTHEHCEDAPVDPPLAAVREAVARGLAEDLLPLGDLTAALLPGGITGRAELVSRELGVVAGRLCVLETFSQLDPAVEVVWKEEDGAEVSPGAVVALLSGPLRSLLSGERTALNFLCHLSGVATLTRRFCDLVSAANPSTRVLDTRKTTPGLRALEKAAVRAGGGWNHRGSLSEAVLVKDNHLAGLSVREAVTSATRRWPGRMVEVECDRVDQVAQALEAGASALLLDNMTLEDVSRSVQLVRSGPRERAPLVEVSGGITLQTAADYARAGVDLVSVGALTHSAPALDIGLDVVETVPRVEVPQLRADPERG